MTDNNQQQLRRLVAKALGKKKLPTNLHLDHIIPKWAGGTDNLVNLQLLRKKEHQLKTAYENAIRERLKRRLKNM